MGRLSACRYLYSIPEPSNYNLGFHHICLVLKPPFSGNVKGSGRLARGFLVGFTMDGSPGYKLPLHLQDPAHPRPVGSCHMCQRKTGSLRMSFSETTCVMDGVRLGFREESLSFFCQALVEVLFEPLRCKEAQLVPNH